MSNLPIEIYDYISTFLYTNCNHCLKKTHINNLQQKVIINKYRHIFDDDYHMPKESIFFNVICNKCLKTYFLDDKKFIYALINHQKCDDLNKCFCRLHT